MQLEIEFTFKITFHENKPKHSVQGLIRQRKSSERNMELYL